MESGVYIDYIDLSKTCLKDIYPLSRIDQLMDITLGYRLLFFIDAFSRYNQICMASKDEKKIAFTTYRCLFCYRVMPFGLKNMGATYQRLMNKFSKIILEGYGCLYG